MTQPDGANRITWRDWDEAAFEAAKSEGKPVLLTLGATWCHWCHVMDQTSYSDSRVIRLVNSRFIPVRVDVDQRPDISLRYNQGGFPSVAFLSGDGEILAGRPYTPPDEMVALLEGVCSGEISLVGEPVPERPSPAASTAVGDSDQAVLKRLTELYDEKFGGFGVEPKQPPWEALHFLTARHGMTGDRATLRMVETTLQGMWQGIYDNKGQGFFRYSVSRDWKVPHYEKMLVSNASLAMAYLEAFQVTRKAQYRAAGEGALSYLLSTLFSPDDGLFFASQDADEPYYQMSWRDRDASHPPPIDRTLYGGWNALAAHALLQAGNVTGNQGYMRLGCDILEKLWWESWAPSSGLRRLSGEASNASPILADQLHLLRAYLTLYQSTGRPDALARAAGIASTVETLFGAPDGGCYDTTQPRSFEAGLLPREQPVLDNAHRAEALLALSHLTGDTGYGDRAAAALSVFETVVPGRELSRDPRVPSHGGGRGGIVPPRGFRLGPGTRHADPRSGQFRAGGRFIPRRLSPSASRRCRHIRSPPAGAAPGCGARCRADSGAGLPGARGGGPVCLHGQPMPGTHHHAAGSQGNGPIPPLGHRAVLRPAPLEYSIAAPWRWTRAWPRDPLGRRGRGGWLTARNMRWLPASSMQSPPTRAEATSVISLSPVLARPGASPKLRCRSTSALSPRRSARVAGSSSPALATRRGSSKAIRMRPG